MRLFFPWHFSDARHTRVKRSASITTDAANKRKFERLRIITRANMLGETNVPDSYSADRDRMENLLPLRVISLKNCLIFFFRETSRWLFATCTYVYIYVRKFDGLSENSIFIKEKFNPIYIFLFYSNITSI